MVSNSNNIPEAFRRPPANGPSFIGMTDEQVLRIAANALRKVQLLPFGSETRDGQWHDFNHAMGELTRRAVNHTLGKIYEIHQREAGQDDEP